MKSIRAENQPGRRKTWLLATGGYLLFVIYGSLVPLDFNPRPLDVAWRDFLATRYLALGVESRADWVANILLYMPLAFLLSAGPAVPRRPAAAQLLRAVAVFLACTALALGVEFTQLFFPPRTVSMNDIVAELIGSALGIAAWHWWGGALARLWTEMKRGGLPAIRAAVVAYVLGYLALSLFPYDFLISAQEFSQKLVSGAYGLLMAPAACERLAVCIGKLGAEIIIVIPLGILFSVVFANRTRRIYAAAALWGLLLGAVIETGQLFIASGISQGISVLTRSAGILLGVVLQRYMRREWLFALRPHLSGAVLLASVPYLLMLMWANGWFAAAWAGWAHAWNTLVLVNWLPFYYHYFTTETGAVVSAAANVAMYLPVGIACWLWRFARVDPVQTTAVPAVIAAAFAGVMEAGKLFVPGKHPDPTAVLIGGVAAAIAYLVMYQFYRWSIGTSSTPTLVEVPRVESQAQAGSWHRVAALAVAGLLLAAVGTAAASYPLPGLWLSIALIGYGFVIWRFPSLALPIALALLPLLNFAQWTGWVLLNEFDLLMGVTLAVFFLKQRAQSDRLRPTHRTGWTVKLLAASFLISAAIGLFPLQGFDQNAISGYWSNFNSLRTLKGFLWGWALLLLAEQQADQAGRLEARIATGMVLGLGAEVIMVMWERLLFTGLFNFSNDYRAIGTFPELHTGGGDIHAYLVLAIPFAVAWILIRPSAVRVVAGGALFALASYALAVTFTRGGYVGYLGAVGVLGIALAIHGMRQRAWKAGRVAIAVVLTLAGVAVVAPIVMGPFMQARLASAHADAGARARHWVRAIDMMNPQLTSLLFGMGLGTFPRTFLMLARDDATATFSYLHDGGNGYVRLGSGRSLYFGQRVAVEGGKNYTLSADLRSSRPPASLVIFLCEKSEQNSFQCREMSFKVQGTDANWAHHEIKFSAGEVGAALGRLHLRRPVFLSFSNAGINTVIDIDNVRLVDENNHELIANGEFSRGGARWFFAADDHLPWHIFNLWVQILFEQGWLGVLAFTVAVVISLARLARKVWSGDVFAGTLLAAVTGFLLIGLTESLFDGPRVTTLFFLLLLLTLRRA